MFQSDAYWCERCERTHIDECDKEAPMLAIRFDDGPGPVAGRFVEVELDGKSVSFGNWQKTDDGSGHWLLVMPEAAEAWLREQIRLGKASTA